jgi:hypothetical protein
MNPLKKGPELKMPDLKISSLKAPPVLEDLFYDLRDRRLLPLVALAVVAIVAVPFLLKDSSPESLPEPAATATGSSVAGGGAKVSRLVVAEADPGLRVPSKRLAKRREKDPFVQKFVAPVANPGAAAQTPETTTTTVTSGSAPVNGASSGFSPPPSSAPAPPPPASPAPGDSGAGGEATPLVAFTYAIDVRITRIETTADGSTQKGEPEVRERVLPPTVLPDKKTQVVTYMGLSPKSGKPLFLVSADVTGAFGEGKCVSGTGSCQLLEIDADPEFPETFLLGEGGVRYKIAVLGVAAVRVSASQSSLE